jgi:hypothetical protein
MSVPLDAGRSPRTTASERTWIAFWDCILLLIPRVLERCHRTNNQHDTEDARQEAAMTFFKLSDWVEAHWDELVGLSGSSVPADANEMIERALSDIAFRQTLAAVRIRKWISNEVLSVCRRLFLRRVEDRSRDDSEHCRDERRRRKYVPLSTNIDRAVAEDAEIVRGGSSQTRSTSGRTYRAKLVPRLVGTLARPRQCVDTINILEAREGDGSIATAGAKAEVSELRLKVYLPSCKDIASLLFRYHTGMLSRSKSAVLKDHIERCDSCRIKFHASQIAAEVFEERGRGSRPRKDAEPRSLPPTVPILIDANGENRAALTTAAKVLSQDVREAVPALIELLQSGDPDLRTAAAMALDWIELDQRMLAAAGLQ